MLGLKHPLSIKPYESIISVQEQNEGSLLEKWNLILLGCLEMVESVVCGLIADYDDPIEFSKLIQCLNGNMWVTRSHLTLEEDGES